MFYDITQGMVVMASLGAVFGYLAGRVHEQEILRRLVHLALTKVDMRYAYVAYSILTEDREEDKRKPLRETRASLFN